MKKLLLVACLCVGGCTSAEVQQPSSEPSGDVIYLGSVVPDDDKFRCTDLFTDDFVLAAYIGTGDIQMPNVPTIHAVYRVEGLSHRWNWGDGGLIISRNQERHHNWGCFLANNYLADEISEAAIGLLFVVAD